MFLLLSLLQACSKQLGLHSSVRILCQSGEQGYQLVDCVSVHMLPPHTECLQVSPALLQKCSRLTYRNAFRQCQGFDPRHGVTELGGKQYKSESNKHTHTHTLTQKHRSRQNMNGYWPSTSAHWPGTLMPASVPGSCPSVTCSPTTHALPPAHIANTIRTASCFATKMQQARKQKYVHTPLS